MLRCGNLYRLPSVPHSTNMCVARQRNLLKLFWTLKTRRFARFREKNLFCITCYFNVHLLRNLEIKIERLSVMRFVKIYKKALSVSRMHKLSLFHYHKRENNSNNEDETKAVKGS